VFRLWTARKTDVALKICLFIVSVRGPEDRGDRVQNRCSAVISVRAVAVLACAGSTSYGKLSRIWTAVEKTRDSVKLRVSRMAKTVA